MGRRDSGPSTRNRGDSCDADLLQRSEKDLDTRRAEDAVTDAPPDGADARTYDKMFALAALAALTCPDRSVRFGVLSDRF